jgi:hypothetical protein
MRGRFAGNWITNSENVLLLFEPVHYPIAYLPEADVSLNSLEGRTYKPPSRSWAHILVYRPSARAERAPSSMATHIDLPRMRANYRHESHSPGSIDAFYEEGERIVAMRRQLSRHRHPPDISSSRGSPW